MPDVDLVNRDPNNLNDHIKVAFDEVIAEPDGSHSFDCVWRVAHCLFTCTKGCCYNTLAVFCGFPLALCWGCEFGLLTFVHIWEISPMLRIFMINCGCAQKFYGTMLQCILAPFCETCGLIFSSIVVKKT